MFLLILCEWMVTWKTSTVPLNLVFYSPKFEKIHEESWRLAANKEEGVVQKCTAVSGKKVHCSFCWEESVLQQFLERKCTAVSGKKVYSSFCWEESVLQFLERKCTAVSGKKVYCRRLASKHCVLCTNYLYALELVLAGRIVLDLGPVLHIVHSNQNTLQLIHQYSVCFY